MKRMLVTLASLLVFTLSGVTKAQLPVEAGANKNVEVSFVLLANQADIKSLDKKPGTFLLTLKRVSPKVIYFSERPARMSGHLTTANFVKEWSNGGFSKSAPNGVLEAVQLKAHSKQDQAQSSYPIVLTHPHYNEKKDMLSFEVSALPGNTMKLLTIAKSDYVAVFVDSVCLTCVGG